MYDTYTPEMSITNYQQVWSGALRFLSNPERGIVPPDNQLTFCWRHLPVSGIAKRLQHTLLRGQILEFNFTTLSWS